MRLVEYDKARQRLWISGARIHHGAVGLVLVLAGIWLMWDDRRDIPWISDHIS